MPVPTHLRVFLPIAIATLALTGCGLPPLHRSVVVQTNDSGVPVHAGGQVAHDHYTVARGDTLYSIAFRTRIDYHQLARWNGIGAPYMIYPGEVLRLTRPPRMAATPPQAPVFQTVTPAPAPTSGVSVAPAKVAATVAAVATRHVAAPATPKIPAAAASTTVVVAGQGPITSPPPTADSNLPIPAGATRNAAGITWRWPAAGTVINHFDPGGAMPGIIIAGQAGEPVRAAAAGVVVYSGNGLVGYGGLIVIKHNADYLTAYSHNSKRLVEEGEHVKAGQIIARMGSIGAPRDELEFQVRYKSKPVDPLSYLPKR